MSVRETNKLVSLCLLLGLSGCAGATPEPTAMASTDTSTESSGPSVGVAPVALEATELYQAGRAGLTQVNELPGLQLKDAGSFVFDPLPSMGANRMRLLLVQAGAVVNFSIHIKEDIRFPALTASNDASEFETVCKMSTVSHRLATGAEPGTPLPGEFYLQRSLGLAVDDPTELPRLSASYGFAGGAVAVGGGGGGFGAEGYVNGTLAEGEWVLIGGGIGGLDPPQLLKPQTTWYYAFTGDAPLRIYDLNQTRLHCGYGFADLANATLHSSAPQIQIGGDRTVAGPYGNSALFHASCIYSDPPNPSNRATLDFAGVSHVITSATTSFSQGSFNNAPATLRVERWIGAPIWLLAGLGVHHDKPWMFSVRDPTGMFTQC